MASAAENMLRFFGGLAGGDNLAIRTAEGMTPTLGMLSQAQAEFDAEQGLRERDFEAEQAYRQQQLAQQAAQRRQAQAEKQRLLREQEARNQAIANTILDFSGGVPTRENMGMYNAALVGVTPQVLGQITDMYEPKPAGDLVEVYDPSSGSMRYIPKKQAVGMISEIPKSEEKKDFKDAQLKSASFANRMMGAVGIIDELEGLEGFSPHDKGTIAASVFGESAENLARTPQQQRYKNAADDWIRSKLRRESGAVIGEEEMESEYRTYFPQIGDTPEVVAQKKILRDRATKNMISESSGAYEELFGGSLATQPQNRGLSPRADGDIYSPQTQEDYNKIPSGGIFIDPDDGKRYRKP